jgi:hypothetical protein
MYMYVLLHYAFLVGFLSILVTMMMIYGDSDDDNSFNDNGDDDNNTYLICFFYVRSLCLKFPKKHLVMMSFLSSMLRDEVNSVRTQVNVSLNLHLV